MNFDFTLDDSTEVSVTKSTLDPETIWDEREEWIEREEASLGQFEALDPERREMIVRAVRNSLQNMIERADTWIPSALDIHHGDYIDVKIRLIFADPGAEL